MVHIDLTVRECYCIYYYDSDRDHWTLADYESI